MNLVRMYKNRGKLNASFFLISFFSFSWLLIVICNFSIVISSNSTRQDPHQVIESRFFVDVDGVFIQQGLIQHDDTIDVQPIRDLNPANTSNNDDNLPHGGLAFSIDGSTTGLLLLPPNALKKLERASSNELFHVISCPDDCLELIINKTMVKLSQGYHFYVPSNNNYSLRNLSNTETIKMIFTLFKN